MDVTREKSAEAFGCDIGNGFGFISLLEKETNKTVPMIPAKYNLKEGMPTTAYIVPPRGETIEIFDFAHGCAQKSTRKNPERGIYAVKTRLKEEKICLKGIETQVSCDEVYAAIARDLVLLANEARAARAQSPLYDIVMTFPASFSDNISLLNRMQNSIEKISLDGQNLKVVGRLPEPAAVAIDYLYYVQNVETEALPLKDGAFTVLVYDLGHGTFDTALVTARSKGEPYEVLAKQGLPEVGGKNFDELLYEEICALLKKEYGYEPRNLREKEDLRLIAVETKHALSKAEEYTAQPFIPNGYAEVTVTRARFEELIAPVFNQTLELVLQMLDDAEERNIKVDCIVLSGGASQMPVVKKSLETIVDGKLPVMLYRPSEAVSFGASRYAQGLARNRASKSRKTEQNEVTTEMQTKNKNTVLEQNTEYKYGIFRSVANKLDGEIFFVVNGGEKLPATSEDFVLSSRSSRIQLRINRASDKKCASDTANLKECIEMIRITFDVTPDVPYRFTLTMEEDYNISVICRAPDGTVQKKSTADM